MKNLLSVDNLEIGISNKKELLKIVNGVSFDLNYGETLGIVGESGCGKSVTALSIMGLLGREIGILNGTINFESKEISSYKDSDLRKLCGKSMGMIFQEPMTALNPMFTIGKQLSDAQILHLGIKKKEAYDNSEKLLKSVGIDNAKEVLKSYPHEFSGGMRQRVLIAMAISCNPSLVIADEPTTALDVVIQGQILKIIKTLVEEKNMSLLLISHDLSVIAHMTKRVIVMYAGEVVEEDRTENIIYNPKHPYTKALVESAFELRSDSQDHLNVVSGTVPRPEEKIIGCKFAKRCKYCMDICNKKKPSLKEKISHNGKVRCWLDFEGCDNDGS